MEELRGRNALVTGAGGGLGGYIARALAAEGVNLALTDLPGPPWTTWRPSCAAAASRSEYEPADLADADERRRLAAWAEEALGPLDILVNNAGLEFGGGFLRTTEEELEAIVAVNLLAVMDLTRIVLPGMLERGRGHVVNMASLAGKAPLAVPGVLLPRPSTAWSGSPTRCGPRMEPEPVGFSAICPVSSAGWACTGGSSTADGRASRVGTVPPESVGDAVVRAIRQNLAEVIVSGRPVRPLVLLNALVAPSWRRGLARSEPCGSSRSASRGPAIASSGPTARPPAGRRPGRKPTARSASIGGPEKGGGPNLSHMFLGTPEVQGR